MYRLDAYVQSNRKNEVVPDIAYPFHDKTITVTSCERICLGNKKNYSTLVQYLLDNILASVRLMTKYG